MPPKRLGPKLLSWASEIDDVTVEQARRLSRLPIVDGHVALMPDAHLGLGATIGSVIPTSGAIIPAAVGVDIGCGMTAARTDLDASSLPESLEPLLGRLERAIPAGLGRWHGRASRSARAWFSKHPSPSTLTSKQENKVLTQFGTLGSGNHFLEVDLDELDRAWVVLHSGSRGIGNQLADDHIKSAKRLAATTGVSLVDPDLASFQEKTPEFERYVADMLWAQDYARANREAMMDAAVRELLTLAARGREIERIDCHHNYAALEHHGGRQVWITRKGAISAEEGDLGVVAGSMGTGCYIVCGKGEPLSYRTSAHGAGRRLSRRGARKAHTPDEITAAMGGIVWLRAHARALLDEIPAAYKDIKVVMNDQRDLAEVVHELHPLLNYKGVG